MADYHILPNESEEEYIVRVCSAKEQIGTWQDVCDILNKELGYDYSESKYRKASQCYTKYLNANLKNIVTDDEYLSRLEESKRELERLKVKYRDERNAWSKQNRIEARVEQKLDYLEERLSDIGKRDFVSGRFIHSTNDYTNEMLILCSDWHIGQCFDGGFGKYNSDIAEQRISKYLAKIYEFSSIYKVRSAKIVLLGDMLSGNIHKSLQITNRENVIEQVKLASELIASLCSECCKFFYNVDVYSVVGNHTRIDRKEDALHSERLDDLIFWSVKNIMSVCPNIKFHSNRDNGIAEFDILGQKIVATHGDYEPHSKQGVSDLSFMLGYIPNYWLRGHYHSPSFNEFNGVTCVQGGSLASTGDNYTLEKRITGSASQTICIFDNDGLVAHLPIKL